MRKFFKTATAFFVFAAFLNVYGGVAKKTIKPKNVDETAKVKILGRTYVYYALNEEKPAIVSVRGPAKIKIYARGVCNGKTEKLSFEVRYSLDGGKPVAKRFRGIPVSEKAEFVGLPNVRPTENRNVTIKIPEGYHTLEVFAPKNGAKVYAKFHLYRKKAKKKKKWISLEPLAPVQPVNLIANEELAEYYRFSKTNPVRVSVIGPTQLRILTRAETDEPTKKNVRYRVTVSENGELLNSYLLWTSRSYSTQYEKGSDYIANKAREIILNVPEGLHVYEIASPDENSSVLARFFIPYKDVNIGLGK